MNYDDEIFICIHIIAFFSDVYFSSFFLKILEEETKFIDWYNQIQSNTMIKIYVRYIMYHGNRKKTCQIFLV